jgi:hypothetical protein
MKSSLLLVSLLLFATSAHAQHSHSHSPAMGGGNGSGIGNNWGNWGGGWSSGSIGSHGRPLRYEAPRNYSVEYATNDGPFVPSTYIDYEDAVALGQQQLAAAEKASQGDTTPSLGDVARFYRSARVPTMKLESRVLQDNSGRLEVCNLNGNDCHRP